MSAFHAIVYLVMKLAIPAAALAGAAYFLLKLLRRWRGLGNDSCSAGAPFGSRTSAFVETISVVATGGMLAAMVVMQDQWTRYLFGPDANSSVISVVNTLVTILAAIGCLVAFACAWRGAGSVAVVLLAVTLFGYATTVNLAARPPWRMPIRSTPTRPSFLDMELILDVGGCNVNGAELRANGVDLGESPVRVKLSEFLEKVPDWEKAPGPTWATGSSTAGDDSVAAAMPRDLTWGIMSLPEVEHVNLPEPIEKAIRDRKGRFIYLQLEYGGELGERTGSADGGGSSDTYQLFVNFRFAKREAAIERLLDQARLSDYQVDDKWLEAAAAFGPDAWIAIRQATVNEPKMQHVFDAWAEWEYQLDEVRGMDAARGVFDRIMHEADERGEYFTGSPTGRAVELLWRRFSPWPLVDAALPLIDSTTRVSIITYPDAFGGPQVVVYAPDARRLQLPYEGRGNSVYRGWSGGGDFPPSGGVLAHAIWLADGSMLASDEFNELPNFFQGALVPPLLRADVEARGPLALTAALALGGPELEKFLIRQYQWTSRPGEQLDFADREQGIGGEDVNRWLLAAARLPGAAGRHFRGQHREELFSVADELAQYLFGSDEVARRLDFLFLENDRGPKSIAMEYLPQFRGVVESRRAHQALELQVSYLIASEPASTTEEYLALWMNDTDSSGRNDFSDATEQLKQLRKLPMEKCAAVLDALLAYYGEQRARGPLPYDDYILRELRRYRFDEIDDAASVAYQLKALRAGPPEGATREWQIEQFTNMLTTPAAAKPLLVESLATAPEAELRLLALDSLRADPLPRFQKLLPALLHDPDEKVRAAAEGVQKQWDSLRTAAG